jgi:hypothetical protein
MFQAAFLGRARGEEWADDNKAAAPSWKMCPTHQKIVFEFKTLPSKCGQRNLCKKVLQHETSSPNNVQSNKSRRMRWVWHLAYLERIENEKSFG